MKVKSQIVYPQLGIVDEVEEEILEEEEKNDEEISIKDSNDSNCRNGVGGVCFPYCSKRRNG